MQTLKEYGRLMAAYNERNIKFMEQFLGDKIDSIEAIVNGFDLNKVFENKLGLIAGIDLRSLDDGEKETVSFEGGKIKVGLKNYEKYTSLYKDVKVKVDENSFGVEGKEVATMCSGSIGTKQYDEATGELLQEEELKLGEGLKVIEYCRYIYANNGNRIVTEWRKLSEGRVPHRELIINVIENDEFVSGIKVVYWGENMKFEKIEPELLLTRPKRKQTDKLPDPSTAASDLVRLPGKITDDIRETPEIAVSGPLDK